MSRQAGPGRRLAFALAALIVTIGALGGTAWSLNRLRAAAVERQFETAAISARAFEDHLTQSFTSIDRTLANLDDTPRTESELTAALRQAPYLRSISLLDKTGAIVASSNPRNVGHRVDRRDFLPQSGEPVAVLRIGLVQAGRDFYEARPTASEEATPATSFIPATRDIRLANGKWATLAASVNTDYFLNFYGNHVAAETGLVRLLRYDGRLLLSTDESLEPDALTLARIEKNEIGHFEQRLADGRTVLTAYRASRSHPFVLEVHFDKEQVLSPWREEAKATASIVAAVLLLSLTLASLYFLRLEKAARQRELDEERLSVAAIAFEAQEGMVITDARAKILQVNIAFTTITGFTAEESIGRPMNLLRSGIYDEAFYAAIWQQLGRTGAWSGELLNRHKDGAIRSHAVTITAVTASDGTVTHYVGTFTDITERKQVEAERKELNRDFVAFLENTSDFIYFKDANSRFRFCSQTLADITGHASWRDMIGKHDSEVFPEETARIYTEEEAPVFRDGVPLLSRTDPYCDAGGAQGWVSTSKWPIFDETGKVDGIFGISRDVTRSMRTEIDLRIAATAFESHEGMFITDADSVIVRVNRAFTEITGYAVEDALGKTPKLLSSGHHDADYYAAMKDSVMSTGAWQGEIWNRRKSGEVYPEWLTITAVKDGHGAITHYVATLTDITQRKASEDEIKHLAFYDPLTRLPNRRLLLDRLQHALASSARDEREGALLFIDLDNFKILNDTFGHDRGDQLLQQVAERLTGSVREGDTVARLGGDEFVVMLEDLSEERGVAATQAEAIAEKIRTNLNQPYDLGGIQYHNTPSIGITLFADHQNTVDELMKRADLAMYNAKAAGRNTLRFFDPEMQAVVTARASIEQDLREGLRRSEFLVYYQPQVDATGRVIGAEALVRWPHPERGLISPADFVPLAEETGIILPLGRWVLETACRQLAAWATQPAMAHLTIAVNVSARQFHQTDFVAQVIEILDSNGADAQKLKLELTESLLLEDVEDIIAKMETLKTRGVSFSLDDFGTGYSSLAYLSRLPLDQLKIDRSFVMHIESNDSNAAICAATISLAHGLKLKVVAEGVETEAQRYFLNTVHGCDFIQGYLFSRALPVDEFESLLTRQN
jgi:diguanylate cyclase (GGDEF)-like protein/PAS domain S-box-containing protein